MSWTDALRLIWELAVELAFDCYYNSGSFPNARHNHVGLRLQDSSALMVTHIRRELKSMSQKPRGPACLKLVQCFLDDVALQLQIANGLGFIDAERFRSLNTLALALEKLIAVRT